LKKLNSLLSLALLLAAAAGLHAQSVTVSQSSLSFSASVGGAVASQTINVGSSTGAAIFFAVQPNTTWLKCNPCTGTTPSTVTVTADPTGLQVGNYSASLTVSGGTGSAAVVSVSFSVGAIAASPTSLAFTYTAGTGGIPPAQAVMLNGQATGFTTAVTTTAGGNWLQATPASGSAPGNVTVVLNAAVVPGLAVGSYNGLVTITPATGPAITVTVTLTISPAPPVTVSTTSLSLAYQLSGTNNNPSQTLTLATTGSQQLTYALSSSANPNPAGRNWIVLNPTSGTIPTNGNTQFTVSYDTTANLPTGTYTGTVTVVVGGGLFPNGTNSQVVNVTLLVSSSPLLLVPSSQLSFTYELGGSVPAAKTFTPCSTSVSCTATSGQANITVAASVSTPSGGTWLSVNPASGTTGQAYSVSVTPGSLAIGTYTGTITVTMPGAGNSPQTVPVQLIVANDPVLETSVSSLSFPYQTGQAAPASQAVNVTTSTGAPLIYTAAAANTGCTWVTLGGTIAGSTPGTFTVSANPAGLAAGTYTCTIGITATVPSTGAAAINSISVPVTLTVSNNPLLTVTLPGNPPSPPSFTALQGGTAPPAQTITLGSTSPGTNLNYSMTFTTQCGGNWLLAAPLTGTTATGSNTLTVSVQPGLLSAGGGCGLGGAYTGTLTITASNPGGPNSGQVDNATAANPVVIPVSFQVNTGALSASPASLNFTQALGSPAPAAQNVSVTSTGAALNYTVAVNSPNMATWVSATPTAGTTPGTIAVSVDGSKLNPGSYTSFVTVTAPNGGSQSIPVNLTVTPGTISAPTTTLTFTQVAGGPAPAAQTVAVSGTTGLNFTVAASVTSPSGGTWLSAAVGSGTATSGTTPANVSVSVSAGSLAPGTYTGGVVITSQGATGSPITIPVSLTVAAPVTLTATPTSLTFNYTLGAATPPAAQNVQLTASASAPFTAAAKTTDGASWLTITPASGTAGTTAMAVSIGINTAALTTAGNYTGTITFSSSAAVTPATVNVSLSVVAIPTPVITGIQNAASYSTGAVSPGENIVIYGTGIGPATLATLQVANGLVVTTIQNTQVFFDSTAAPIIYTSAGQTSVMVPHEIAGRATTQITVVFQGVKSAPLTYNVVAAVPGIYTQNLTGTGPGSILNQDNSVNGPTSGAPKGSIVQVFLTGTGDTTPALVTGLVNTTLKTSLLNYTATIGGLPATVVYQGTAPELVEGVMQFNVTIPANAPSGPLPIVISSTSGNVSYSTQAGVTVQVQ